MPDRLIIFAGFYGMICLPYSDMGLGSRIQITRQNQHPFNICALGSPIPQRIQRIFPFRQQAKMGSLIPLRCQSQRLAEVVQRLLVGIALHSSQSSFPQIVDCLLHPPRGRIVLRQLRQDPVGLTSVEAF